METRSLTVVLEVKLESLTAEPDACRAVWEFSRIENDEVLDEVSVTESVELVWFDERELHVSLEGDRKVIDEVFAPFPPSSDHGSIFDLWFSGEGPWEVNSEKVVANLKWMLSETRDYVEGPDFNAHLQGDL